MQLDHAHVDKPKLLSHDVQRVVAIGAGGLTDSLLKALDRELACHELVRVRIPFGDRSRRERILAELLPRSQAVLVRRCGCEALLYRPAGAALTQAGDGAR
jgi:RNA-binding protein